MAGKPKELVMSIKILVVFGTRPEAIKMLPLCRVLLENQDDFDTKICVTAQHREMLDQVLDIFDIQPDIDLDIMRHGQDLTDVTSSILVGMRNIFSEYKPDLVLVHGDTTTTLASAIAAFYSKIPVGHVEAGLRTNNIQAPFPEEFNRQVVSRITRFHFAPTELSRSNLESEGHLQETIAVTGNTVIDALFWVLKRLDSDTKRKDQIIRLLQEQLPFDFGKTRYVLITGHRRENFGGGFINICEAIAQLAIEFPTTHFVYPVHLNPNVQEPVINMLSEIINIHLINPLDYEPFVYLLRNCYLVLTDSGGIQEEAPSLGKPVLVMRDVTERPEAIAAGTVKLVGADKIKIVNETSLLLEDASVYLAMTRAHNPYGDGNACDRIIGVIKEEFCEEI
jgi:UDP-N-acetylglucosamine 2-epimerase (non-hydrolysing)